MWDNRFLGNIGNDALVTIDGTDLKAQKRYDKRFFSHKFKSGGLRYEVGVCIVTGHIVWINGPFRCSTNDITIVRQCALQIWPKMKWLMQTRVMLERTITSGRHSPSIAGPKRRWRWRQMQGVAMKLWMSGWRPSKSLLILSGTHFWVTPQYFGQWL